MSIVDIISLGGGLALFLYGMTVMGGGLEKLSGGKMEKTLEKLTGNIFLSVLVGAVVTATIQSSSATTVIVVGLVNAGILGLRQAIGVIMGANIGTTITAQIIRLSDISSDNLLLNLFKPAALAPMAAVAGVCLFLFAKQSKKREIGQMLLGFAVLFTGLFAMEDAVSSLRTSPVFMELLSSLSNPILGVLAGAFVTAVIQSSSASVGILQAISSTGILKFSAAFPIIMGQNIGTCITPILSSIGASKNAKRSALIHLYFNICGTVIVLVAFYSFNFIIGTPSYWDDPITKGGIANFHTLFNIAVTIIFLPFVGLLEKLALSTIKQTEDERKNDLVVLDERFLKSPNIALQQSAHVLLNMAKNARANYYDCVSLLDKYDTKIAERAKEVENVIDKSDDALEAYLIKLSANPLSADESHNVTSMMHLISEFERIGDYSINIMESAETMHDNQISFSQEAVHEVGTLTSAVGEIIQLALNCCETYDVTVARKIEPLEETIDKIVDKLKDMHIERLKAGVCSIHSGIVFLEILTNLERIADHCSNVGVYVIMASNKNIDYDKHEYLRKTHYGSDSTYHELHAHYLSTYFDQINSCKQKQ